MTRTVKHGALLRKLGGISAKRLRLNPTPGTATIRDVLRLQDKDLCILELIEGIVVAKVMGFVESVIAGRIATAMNIFATEEDLGIVVGSKGLMKFARNTARSPEVSFVNWKQLPEKLLPRTSVPRLHPDLAVEVFRRGNTRGEMRRKRKEFFAAGCQLFWIVYPRARTVDVYESPHAFTTLSESDSLEGAGVLPGFVLDVSAIFEKIAVPRSKQRKRR